MPIYLYDHLTVVRWSIRCWFDSLAVTCESMFILLITERAFPCWLIMPTDIIYITTDWWCKMQMLITVWTEKTRIHACHIHIKNMWCWLHNYAAWNIWMLNLGNTGSYTWCLRIHKYNMIMLVHWGVHVHPLYIYTCYIWCIHLAVCICMLYTSVA